MKRREFVTGSMAGLAGLAASRFAFFPPGRPRGRGEETLAATRKILVAGGAYGTPWIRYMAQLTGKPRPKLLYLPTASADSESGTISWYRACATLDVEPHDQISFIASSTQKADWAEVLLSMDGIVVSGGNTLNQQAIWKAQGIDVILRQAWDAGIVLGGASAGGLCWFEEGTTDSRPKELSIVHCLGFLKGSYCPHYDAEKDRRPFYLKIVGDGTLEPGYAMDNDAGVYFEDNAMKRVVTTKATSKVYRVDRVDGKPVETVFDGQMIS